MEDNQKDPKNYELAVLVKSEDQVPTITAFLSQYHEAPLTREPSVKKLAFAYSVKKENEGIFISYLFSTTPDFAKKLEKDLTLRTDVLRSMIIIAVPANEVHVPPGGVPFPRRRPSTRPAQTASEPTAPKSAAPIAPITNDALEKKIEEILS